MPNVMCNCFAVKGKNMKSTHDTHWKLWIILLVAFLNGLLMNRGSACQCFSGPPCEAYKYSGVIFIGELLTQQNSGFGGRIGILYSFKVTKLYKGKRSGEMKIMSGFGGGDCGYPFEKGIPYLIYADSIQGGVLYTDICTRTRQVREAALDLSYLDNLPKSAEQTHAWGSIMQFDSLTDYYIKFKPSPGVQISTVANGQRLKTFSDSLGNFEFVNLPPDSYKFSITVPHNFMLEYGDAYTEVRLAPSGCAMIPLTLGPDGGISGRVLDNDGKSVPLIDVDLMAVDSGYSNNSYLHTIGTRGYTNRDGRYTIRGVPPGKYYVGVNLIHEPRGRQPFPPTFYPGVTDRSQARKIEMKLGDARDSTDILMQQQYAVKKIEGILKYSDGSPVRGGYVTFDETRTKVLAAKQYAESAVDSTGHFSLPALRNQKGWIHATINPDPALKNFVVTNPEPIEITASEGTRVFIIKFALKPNR